VYKQQVQRSETHHDANVRSAIAARTLRTAGQARQWHPRRWPKKTPDFLLVVW